MNWTKRFNCAVAYLEENLAEEMDYAKAAAIAGCPAYYFQKLFFYVAGIPLAEYIRRRRMSLAAADLQSTREKVVDIALKYGYSSPTAFNRAFQSVHGVAPSRARREKVVLKTYPALFFTAAVQGTKALEFKLETKKAFRIVGISCPLSQELAQNFSSIPKEWDKALHKGTLKRLAALMEETPGAFLGVSVHHTENWKYFIAVSTSQKAEEFEEYQIPAAVWAVFAGRGSNRSLQELERRVITEWLPASGYAYAKLPDVEVYYQADPADAIYEYWLPVVKAGK